jgi:exopolysaccharide biosynthesis protein
MILLKKSVIWLIAACIYLYISTSLLVFHGPFQAFKGYIIDSLATTRHASLLRPLSLYTLSNATINAHKPHLTMTSATITADDLKKRDYSYISDQSIEISNYQGSTYSAKIMLIHNPKRVKVAITKDIGTVGQSVSELCKQNNAVAGINAGSFNDAGYKGTGGLPEGITIHDGKMIGEYQSTGSATCVIGMTKLGQLIAGPYTPTQLDELGVTEAVSFGPVLVKNGRGLVQGNGGWGNAPRTVIGQRADGTVIFIVTDGRGVNGLNDLGATLKDMQDLMIQNGAVIAANLDGGSSTTMYNNGHLVNQPTDILGERKVATAFVVSSN